MVKSPSVCTFRAGPRENPFWAGTAQSMGEVILWVLAVLVAVRAVWGLATFGLDALATRRERRG